MIKVPPAFVRNHPSQTQIKPPDDAAEYLQREMEAQTGKRLDESSILDVGCGTRFAIAIHNKKLDVGNYTGIDIDAPMVAWLQKNLPEMTFVHWPVHNPTYNPNGVPLQDQGSFPVVGKYDVICFFSVFTHLNEADARAMLGLAMKSLAEEGRLFLTVFVDEAEGYREGVPERPSLVSKFGQTLFEEIVEDAGFVIVGFQGARQLMAPQYALKRR